MNSLRVRVTLGVLLGQLALLSGGTAIAYHFGSKVVTEQFDEALKGKVATFESLVEQEGDFVGIEHVDGLLPEYERENDPEYFEVLRDGRGILARSPSLEGVALVEDPAASELGVAWDQVLPDGRSGRFVALPVVIRDVEADEESGLTPPPADLRIVLAKSRAPLDLLESRLLAGLLGAAALLAVFGIGLIWWAVGVCLDPVRRFGERVARVDAHTLAVPLEDGEFPVELKPIVAALNGLLARLDGALRSERRTAANVAHELKTPISELRALTEIALQAESSPDYRHRALGDAHEIALQLDRLVGLVRQLTMIETRSTLLPGQDVVLRKMLRRVESAVSPRARERGIALVVDVNGAVAECDPDALLSVCNNLVGNAVEYAPGGTRVVLSGAASNGMVAVRIENDCPDLTEQDLAHLTEPFWRGSAARSENDHHGLGLTIAHGMARLAGIDLSFRIDAGRLVAEATMPAHTGADPRDD